METTNESIRLTGNLIEAKRDLLLEDLEPTEVSKELLELRVFTKEDFCEIDAKIYRRERTHILLKKIDNDPHRLNAFECFLKHRRSGTYRLLFEISNIQNRELQIHLELEHSRIKQEIFNHIHPDRRSTYYPFINALRPYIEQKFVIQKAKEEENIFMILEEIERTGDLAVGKYDVVIAAARESDMLLVEKIKDIERKLLNIYWTEVFKGHNS